MPQPNPDEALDGMQSLAGRALQPVSAAQVETSPARLWLADSELSQFT